MVEKSPLTLTPRSVSWIGACALVAAISFGSAVRIHSALSLPGFASNAVEGMLKSDAALLYYMTQRIVESGGLPPDDFRADPRVEHPETSDLPAMFTVGQEFLVACCQGQERFVDQLECLHGMGVQHARFAGMVYRAVTVVEPSGV